MSCWFWPVLRMYVAVAVLSYYLTTRSWPPQRKGNIRQSQRLFPSVTETILDHAQTLHGTRGILKMLGLGIRTPELCGDEFSGLRLTVCETVKEFPTFAGR